MLCKQRPAALQLGVVAPSAMEGFAQLPDTCTSLEIHGDQWEVPVLSGKHLRPLCALTALQHLGLFHYSLGSNEAHSPGMPGLCCEQVSASGPACRPAAEL